MAHDEDGVRKVAEIGAFGNGVALEVVDFDFGARVEVCSPSEDFPFLLRGHFFVTILNEGLHTMLIVPFKSNAFFETEWAIVVRFLGLLDCILVEIVIEFVKCEPSCRLYFLIFNVYAYLAKFFEDVLLEKVLNGLFVRNNMSQYFLFY